METLQPSWPGKQVGYLQILTFQPLFQNQLPSFPSWIADTCCNSLPPSLVDCTDLNLQSSFFPLIPLSSHQLHLKVLENSQATPAREASNLHTDLHCFLLSSKSNPAISPAVVSHWSLSPFQANHSHLCLQHASALILSSLLSTPPSIP